MLKALLKKQFLELNVSFVQNRKTGKNRSKGGIVGYAIFFVAVFAVLGFTFYELAAAMAMGMVMAGLDWLFFAIMGLVAIALGVFGSVFNTYSGLYLSKDNELLLSMPIPVRKILAARLIGVYAIGMLYEAIVLIPTLIAYWIVAETTARSVVCGILMVFVVGVLILTLTCALGYVVARISTKLKNKSYITVLLSLIFISAYYFVYFRFNTMLQSIILDGSAAEKTVRTWIYPAYLMGRASCGDALSMVLYTLGVAVLFGLCYYILDRTFLKIATSNKGEKKVVYKEKETKAVSVKSALMRREWKRFTSSATYMLNCGLGTLLLPIAAIAVMIKRDALRVLLGQLTAQLPVAAEFIPLGIVVMVCMLITMNDTTAPSISLEGKTIWIMQSLPVDPWDVLSAKLNLQYYLNIIPAVMSTLALCWVAELEFNIIIFVMVVALLFAQVLGELGLILNLKKPNLHWTNETLVIKQSGAALIVIFGGWAMAAVMGVGYYFLKDMISCSNYLIGLMVLLALLTRYMQAWLRKKGTLIFASL